MAAKRRTPDEPTSFAELLDDVEPIADRDRHPPQPSSDRRPKRPDSVAAPAFRFPVEGERLLGAVDGVDRRVLRQLRSGRISPDATIDLHGESAAQAERSLRDGVRRARERNARCLLVVHGRGLHSREGPVLRDSLPKWLTSPPIAEHVLAFAPAPESGGGATAVLLRR